MLNEQTTAAPKRLKILLVGDGCIDTLKIVSKANRANPEDPTVPLYTRVSSTPRPGMAFNLLEAFKKLDFANVSTAINTKSHKVRYYDTEGNYLFRVDNDSIAEPKPIDLDMLEPYDVCVVSDYNKGSVTDSLLHQLIRVGKPVFIDTKKTNLADFSAANVIFKINELEYDRMDHSKTFNGCSLIVTRGSYGSEWLKLNEVGIFSSEYSKGYSIKAKDVCGAGDMYLAGLVYGMHISDNSREKAMKIANAYAAISVQHLGVYVPSKTDLINFLREHKIND